MQEGDLPTLLRGISVPRRDLPGAMPPDLLRQGPDVRAAGQGMEASRLRVGARKAELLPRLSLTGTLGLQPAESSKLLIPALEALEPRFGSQSGLVKKPGVVEERELMMEAAD